MQLCRPVCLLAAGASAAASVLSQLVVLLQMLGAACYKLPLQLLLSGDASCGGNGGGSPRTQPAPPDCATAAGAGDKGPLSSSHSTLACCPLATPARSSPDSPQQRSNESTPSKGTSSAPHAPDGSCLDGAEDLVSSRRLDVSAQTAVSRHLGEASEELHLRLHIPLLALQFCTELVGALERRGTAAVLAADAAALAGAAAGRATDVHRAASAAAAGLMAAAAAGEASFGESMTSGRSHRTALH